MSTESIISVVVIINFILTLLALIRIAFNDYSYSSRLVDLESENKKLEEKINILEKEIWGLEKFNYDGHYY